VIDGRPDLHDVQVERGARREALPEQDYHGNHVEVLKVPAGFGTFKDPRDAVRAVQAARGGRSAPAATLDGRPAYTPVPGSEQVGRTRNHPSLPLPISRAAPLPRSVPRYDSLTDDLRAQVLGRR
jgi:hypothetical protein